MQESSKHVLGPSGKHSDISAWREIGSGKRRLCLWPRVCLVKGTTLRGDFLETSSGKIPERMYQACYSRCFPHAIDFHPAGGMRSCPLSCAGRWVPLPRADPAHSWTLCTQAQGLLPGLPCTGNGHDGVFVPTRGSYGPEGPQRVTSATQGVETDAPCIWAGSGCRIPRRPPASRPLSAWSGEDI